LRLGCGAASARPECLRLKAGLTVDVEALRVLALHGQEVRDENPWRGLAGVFRAAPRPGLKMHDAGRLLPRFVRFMAERQAVHITARLALEWAAAGAIGTTREVGTPRGFVRRFARFRSATDV